MARKKLELRIARLEKLLAKSRSVKNEDFDNGELANALSYIESEIEKANDIISDGNLVSDLGDVTVWSNDDSVERAYSNLCRAMNNMLSVVRARM